MIICVTGQMAAGKNYVCSLLQEQGWLSLDADVLAKDVLNKNESLVIQTFSQEANKLNIKLTNENGTLNNKALGAVLFANPSLLKKHESIIYPALVQETKRIIKQNNDKNIILNATVLYKTPELLNLCSKIIYVKAPLLTRLIRAKKRDKMSFKLILQRFKAQKNLFNEYKNFGLPIFIINNARDASKGISKFLEMSIN